MNCEPVTGRTGGLISTVTPPELLEVLQGAIEAEISIAKGCCFGWG